MEGATTAQKPQKLLIVNYLHLIAGCHELLLGLCSIGSSLLAMPTTLGLSCLCLPVGLYLAFVGFLAFISGVRGMGSSPIHHMYKPVSIMQIVCLLHGDIISATSGIVSLVLLRDPEVKDFLKAPAKG